MDNNIETNTEQMQSDINTMNDNLANMERAFEEAWEAVDALHSIWEGPAHDILVYRFSQDQQAMKKMMIDLRNYLEELEFAKKEYTNCESNVESLMNGMNV